MKTVRTEHTYSVDRETFVERIFLDEDFNNAVHEFLEFKSRELLEKEEDDEALRLKINFVSGEKLPFVARKLWGDYVGWVEEMVYFKREHRSESKMIPKMLARQVKIAAQVTLKQPKPGKTTYTTDVQIDVKVPLVGGAIAKKMCSDMVRNLEKNFEFTERYLAENGIS